MILCYVYHSLWLFQLLSKKHTEVNSECPSTQPHLLNVDNIMACVGIRQQQITEPEALYMLASRYVELQR